MAKHDTLMPDVTAKRGIYWLGLVLGYFIALSLLGIVTFYIGYGICRQVPSLAIPPIPSSDKLMTFASFGSIMATTIFLFFYGAVVYCLPSSNRGSSTELEKLRRQYKQRLYWCGAVIVSGPFWGGLVGLCGGLLNFHNRTDDRVGFDMGSGIVAGAVGGSLVLTILGGSVLIWTLQLMRKLKQQPASQTAGKNLSVESLPKDVEG